MTNDFRCRHSESLQKHFDICSRGIDYINDFNVFFEFKESFAKKLSQMFFKIPKVQLINSHFIVFCVRAQEFYVHSSKLLLAKYRFNNRYNRCCLRYNTIKKNYIFKTDNYGALESYIESRRVAF